MRKSKDKLRQNLNTHRKAMDFEQPGLDLDEIKLDFDIGEINFLGAKNLAEDPFCSFPDIEDLGNIGCFAAPFFSDDQEHRCICNEIRRKHFGTLQETDCLQSMEKKEAHDCHRNNLTEDAQYPGKCQKAVEKKKNIKIEEFLLELLVTGGYESYIHWTMKDRGEFKITRPQRVASLWGHRKGRKLLSDEKLTRALRYSIRKGKLEKTDTPFLQYRFT